MPEKPQPPHPQRRPKRRITFAAGHPREAALLTERLMEQGISVDRQPVPGEDTIVRAVGDANRHGRPGLGKEMARGLETVKIKSDKTDPE